MVLMASWGEKMKDKKKCHICGKLVYELGLHIANIHPQIMQKLEESGFNETQTSQEKQEQLPSFGIKPPLSQQNRVVVVGQGSINEMIREKLDTMLNIKIIEMLSRNPEVSINDIHQAINPPQNTQPSLQDLKTYHDLVFGEDYERERPGESQGGEWAAIAKEAIPIVKNMLQSKTTTQQGAVANVRSGESTNPGILKPIQLKVTGDTTKPGSNI